jgi:hypothetical protein
MKSRAQHFGPLCPICHEPISTHEVRPLNPFNPLVAQRGAGLRPAYNRLGRNCFSILVRW